MTQVSKAIRVAFSLKLLVKISALMTAGTVLSGTIFYLLAERTPISPSYGRAISNIDIYKNEILSKSIFIYALFAVLILIGVTVLSIIYSHRVAGPLERVKAVSRDIREGKFDANIKFRSNDLIHPLADSINHMAEAYNSRLVRLKEGVDRMDKDAYALEVALKAGDEAGQAKAILALLSSFSEVEQIMAEIKL